MKHSLAYQRNLVLAQLALVKQAINPKTFNEKIAFKAAFDRRSALSTFADKIAVREYVATTVGAKYLSKAYVATHDLSSVDWNALPREFALKANHGSGWNVIVRESADPSVRLENIEKKHKTSSIHVHPDSLDTQAMISLVEHWMGLEYWWSAEVNRMPEWAYKNIQPGILIEELIVDHSAKSAPDFKMHLFNGECRFINVVNRHYFDEALDAYRIAANVMTPDWAQIDLILNDNLPMKSTPKPPHNLDEMIDVASRLANGIDYLRVDLYNVDGRIIFGELTNYPSAGRNTFVPQSFDLQWGQLLNLDGFIKRARYKSADMLNEQPATK
jgi:hypothetical protein